MRRRDERGDGHELPPDSESLVTPNRGVLCSTVYVPGTCGRVEAASESRRLEQSRSESLGATLLL